MILFEDRTLVLFSPWIISRLYGARSFWYLLRAVLKLHCWKIAQNVRVLPAWMANESETDFSGRMDSDSRPETIIIINCVVNGPLILITILGNTLVLAAILRTPSLHSPSIVLLCSLAASDFIVGFFVQPLYIASKLTRNLIVFRVLSIMAASGTGVSLLLMTAISVDRFLALHYHMQYPNLMTTRRAMYTSGSLWLISFLLSLSTFWSTSAYYSVAAICIVICLLLSTVCYLLIYRIVRQHQLQIHFQQRAVENFSAENNLNMLWSTKSAKKPLFTIS